MITPIYAALLVIIYFVLTTRVILARRRQGLAYGSGEDRDTIALMRAHANWAEYAPIGVLLLLTAELQEAGALWLHLSGLILLAGRALHAYGMGFNRKFFNGRVGGTVLTLVALALLTLLNLILAL